MKKILFISSNMEIGGFQKSLISLLREFDYSKYEVDLLLLNPSGIYMDLIPTEVNQITLDIDNNYFKSPPSGIIELIKNKKVTLAIYRIIQSFISKINKGMGGIILSKKMPEIDKEYDVIIDYNGQHILYYMIDKLKAKKKITYFHSDYNKWNYYKFADKKYYKKANYIVTVSDICAESLKENFINEKDKIKVVENIITKDTVNIFPLNSNTYKDNEYTGKRIATIGRLCFDKGIDIAIDAMENLIKKRL